jgi:hypothetical protein
LYYHTLLHRFPWKSQLSIILTNQTWISVKYGACKVRLPQTKTGRVGTHQRLGFWTFSKYSGWNRKVVKKRISMGGFKIEKKPEQISFCSRTNLRFVQNKSPKICSSSLEADIFSSNLQLICDDKWFIRYYVVGYIRPMRDHDIITWSWYDTLYLCRHRRIQAAASKNSRLLSFSCGTEDFKLFNIVSVIIEHINVRIKRRVGSLKGVRNLVQKLVDFERVSGLLYVLFYIIHSWHSTIQHGKMKWLMKSLEKLQLLTMVLI